MRWKDATRATLRRVGFVARVGNDDRALFKLDIEGHELPALEEASDLLGSVEVVVSEVRFFDIHRPLAKDVSWD